MTQTAATEALADTNPTTSAAYTTTIDQPAELGLRMAAPSCWHMDVDAYNPNGCSWCGTQR